MGNFAERSQELGHPDAVSRGTGWLWLASKRLVDVVVASAGLIVLSPALLVVAAAIKLDSPGPILFVQSRVGRGGRPIQVVKLRSMVSGADGIGPGVTAARDPRVTRVGRVIRRTKVDELPQLWNVIRGDMSIVGPRPELRQYVQLYPADWHAILEVRPGLTDSASLTFRDEEALLALATDRERAYREVLLPLKARLALDDVRRSSLRHDLSIVVRTATAVVRGPGPGSARILDDARRRIEQLNEAK